MDGILALQAIGTEEEAALIPTTITTVTTITSTMSTFSNNCSSISIGCDIPKT